MTSSPFQTFHFSLQHFRIEGWLLIGHDDIDADRDRVPVGLGLVDLLGLGGTTPEPCHKPRNE